ncbi:MAG: phage/plasmid primase, P4 family [Aerococcus sp.]|nr:phage/plasmid primase, P4 family [Aerococcus sp.]
MAFPEELLTLNQWGLWRYQERNGKLTKIPINPQTNTPAKTNDPTTWGSYEEAAAALGPLQADGLGFLITPPYIGIDLDHVEEELEKYQHDDIEENKVFEIITAFQSYTEISPSGKGIHIITKGKIPGPDRRRGNVEMYDGGRFFTMTGNQLDGFHEVTEATEMAMDRIYRKYIRRKNNITRVHFGGHGMQHDLSDMEVVTRIEHSQQAEKFKALMKGGWREHYKSQSEADMALANILAFWCAKDFDQMDRLFRQSSLMRDKWDEPRGKAKYGEATLYKAIHDTPDVYVPKPDDPNFGYKFTFLEKDKEYPPRSWDDTGNAQRFMDRYGDIVKYSYKHKKFYVYDGTKWTIDTMGMVPRLIDSVVDQMANEKLHIPDDMDETDAQKAWKRHLKMSRSHRSKENIQKELMHLTAVSTEEFDRDDTLLNTPNGYLELTTGLLKAHDKLKMFTRQTGVGYSDHVPPDTYLAFLDDIFNGDQEKIDFFQRCVGYTFCGSTKEQVMFICHGIGRNGKSVLMEVLTDIAGTYAASIRADSLMVKNKPTPGNDIARLQGARMVTSSEPNEGFRFDEGLIKQLTGGDKVTARFLYGEDFEFVPKFKLWITTNHKPIIRGTDDGIWRRMILIPFEVQIPLDKVDKDLKPKLLREGPGILDWIIEGYRKWQKEGLNSPQSIIQASQDYRTDMDVLEHFIQDECERVEGGRAPAGDLYRHYKVWADESGEYKMNKNMFGKKMKEKFPNVRPKGRVVYEGLVIKDKYEGLREL